MERGVSPLQLSPASRVVAGIVLLSVIAVEFGGWFMTLIVQGTVPMTNFQVTFSAAGHAHAGVLVILSLMCLVLADTATLRGVLGWLSRLCVPVAAVLMSSGFFLSALGKGATEPNGLIALLWIGAASLAIGAITLGVGLLTSPIRK